MYYPVNNYSWRWRESNPRPKGRITSFYKFSRLLLFREKGSEPARAFSQSPERCPCYPPNMITGKSWFLSGSRGFRTASPVPVAAITQPVRILR